MWLKKALRHTLKKTENKSYHRKDTGACEQEHERSLEDRFAEHYRRHRIIKHSTEWDLDQVLMA